MRHEVTFEITELIGPYGEVASPDGWRKELNMVSWNGNPPKYDIRAWDKDHKHMARGITLTEKEMAEIVKLYKKHKEANNEG